MDIINKTPFEVEALPNPGPKGNKILTIIIKGTFEIKSGENPAVAPEQIPIFFGDELYNEQEGGSVKFESDIAPFKPRADIILVGNAYAPEGQAVQILDTMLRVGRLKKVIRVFGDRQWIYSKAFLAISTTKPIFFTEMALVYERAFGGIDIKKGEWCKENPVGRGFVSSDSKKSLDGVMLPNLEDPENLIESWQDHPKPVGFGFYGRSWMPRISYIGTYDKKWREKRSPDPPEDFKYDFYNAAHPDLQIDGYLKGDEEIELLNLTPDGRVLIRLLGINLICKVRKEYSGQISGDEAGSVKSDQKTLDVHSTVQEVTPNLDTLCLIPDEKRFYAVWRGICPINDLTAMEVKGVEIEMIGI